MDKRQILLDTFLRLFGVEKFVLTSVHPDKILGTAIFSDSETQDVCWHMSNDFNLSSDTLHLIHLLADSKYVDIDKLKLSEQELFQKSGWTDRQKFDIALQNIFEIEVKMVDNGQETDSFFIHD